MRITVEKLRTWILLLGVSLILALGAFFVYARYRINKIGRDLPQKMGIEIQQSTNNFTISKSSKGRTLFRAPCRQGCPVQGRRTCRAA